MTALFLQILNMSLAGGVIILAVVVMRALLWRAPRKWVMLLWIAPAVRLVCPVGLTAVFSFFAAMRAPQTALRTGNFTNLDLGGAVMESVGNILPAETPAGSVNHLQTIENVAGIMWLAGMAVLLAIETFRYLKMKALVSDAYVTESGAYETDRISSPFILGIIRPRIYLPLEMGADTRKLVLAHERYHLRKRESLIKLAARAILLVHWFNPLAWLAYRLMSEDIEMRCDEAVLAELCRGEANDSIRKAYSYALVSMASEKTQMHSSLAFGERKVRRRIMNVLRWKEPRKWLSAVLAAVCLIFVVGCVTNPVRSSPADVKPLEHIQDLYQMTKTEALKTMGLTTDDLVADREEKGPGYTLQREDYSSKAIDLRLYLTADKKVAAYQVNIWYDQADLMRTDYDKLHDELVSQYGGSVQQDSFITKENAEITLGVGADPTETNTSAPQRYYIHYQFWKAPA